MHKIEINKNFKVSAEKVWNSFDDFGGVHKFHLFWQVMNLLMWSEPK